jgi:hypothetical protein
LTRTTRLAAAALSVGLAVAGMAPALADDNDGVTDEDAWLVEDEPFRGSVGNLLHGDLLGGLLGGSGGLLGPQGLLGAAGGLLPGLLGGHSSLPEFADGTGDLVEGLSVLPETLAGPPVGGEHTGENVRLGGGVLSGILDVGSILGGLTGHF